MHPISSQYSSRSVKSWKCDIVINSDRKEAVPSATSHKALAVMKKRNSAGKNLQQSKVKNKQKQQQFKETEESQTIVVVNTNV